MLDAKTIIEEKLKKFPLVKKPRCFTFNPENGCYWCGNKTFRFHSKAFGKKYYQCEKCNSLNH